MITGSGLQIITVYFLGPQMLTDLTEIFPAAGNGSLAAIIAINVVFPCFIFFLLGDRIYHGQLQFNHHLVLPQCK